VPLDQQVLDTQVRQKDRCGQAAAAASDDEYGDLLVSHGRISFDHDVGTRTAT
jgi:hypothetical protein